MNKVIFPGSFDPFTIGHANLVDRAQRLFDEVIVAVGYNEQKHGWLPVEERVRALREYYKGNPKVRVESYTGLTVDFAQAQEARFILRGVRSVKDYEYELGIADINSRLADVETVVLLADPTISGISSSVVRELHHFGRDITTWLPQGLKYR
ncbi:MAG: pantetheine-phosphate adenylyltransferase, partial [Bacteroidaceae bacterium]|nr:pantetheine-phosphate adenylyltransferase [Bacteroidaceae bacterium]